MKEQEIIQQTIKNLGIEALNPLQEQCIQFINDNNQLILSATGSGKTLAFLLPLRIRLQEKEEGIQALVIVPTRELAQQVENVFRAMKTNFKVLNCYGGHSFKIEQQSLDPSPAVLIGTPGRICDHLLRSNLDLSTVQQIVIDEYDKCLEFGFEDQMGYIFENCRPTFKTLVSATILQTYPEYITFINPVTHNFLDNVKELQHSFYQVKTTNDNRFDVLSKLITSFKDEQSIVFCNLRDTTEIIKKELNDHGIYAVSYHGGLEQDERERSLFQFRNGSYTTLICTDLGSRGLDIPEIRNVVHFELPPKEDVFIHRNGRTARVNAQGNVFVLLDKGQRYPFEQKLKQFEVPENNVAPSKPKFNTVYFSAGKKDKINKIDLVGFLCQKGNLEKSDIGLIHVSDHASYVAINRKKVDGLLKIIRDQKIKGQKLKISIART